VYNSQPEDDEIYQETDVLTAADAAANDGFGSALGLSGDTALIGIPDADPAGDADAGKVSAKTGKSYIPKTVLLPAQLVSCPRNNLQKSAGHVIF
jgi:hypothetical protein